jgi:Zn-dependent peptidase ImmA (M78 family)
MREIRSQYVRKMAAKVLKDSKTTAPPVNLRVIAEAHSIIYREVEDFPDSVDALIIKDDGAIYAAVNARQHLHRQRFSLAHELGHYFLHGDSDLSASVTIDNPPMEEAETPSKDRAETEADLFAGELLVPLAMLRIHPGKTIPELSKIFVVSEQVIAIAISKHMNALFK